MSTNFSFQYNGKTYLFEIGGSGDISNGGPDIAVTSMAQLVTALWDHVNAHGTTGSINTDWYADRKCCFDKKVDITWRITCIDQSCPNEFVNGLFLNQIFYGSLFKDNAGSSANGSIGFTIHRDHHRQTCYPLSCDEAGLEANNLSDPNVGSHMLRFYETSGLNQNNCGDPRSNWALSSPQAALMHHFKPNAGPGDYWTAWNPAPHPSNDPIHNISLVTTCSTFTFDMCYSGNNPSYTGKNYTVEIKSRGGSPCITGIDTSSLTNIVKGLCSYVDSHGTQDIYVEVDWYHSRKAGFNKRIPISWRITGQGTDFIHGNFLNQWFDGYLLKQSGCDCNHSSLALSIHENLFRDVPISNSVETDVVGSHLLRFFDIQNSLGGNCSDWNNSSAKCGLMHHWNPDADHAGGYTPFDEGQSWQYMYWTANNPGTDPNSSSDPELHKVSIGTCAFAPTDINLSGNTIAENQSSGTMVGTFSTNDPDSSSFTYTLVSGSGDTNNASFIISGDQLKSAASFNYETKNSYSIRVRTTDSGGLSFEKQFTIYVTNVNEVPTNMSLNNASIAENQSIGTIIGTLSTVDPEGGPFTYALVGGYPDNASFSISGNQLKSAVSFNYEVKNSYTIRIRTTDSGGLYFEKNFTISIMNVIEAPTTLELLPISVNENQQYTGFLRTTGPDDPQGTGSYNYTLVSGGADNGLFSISGNQLISNGTFDYETKQSCSVRIRSTNSSDSSLYIEKTFTINVININEAPTDITLSANTIAENQAVGTLIGTLSTTDSDAGETNTYSIVGGDIGSFNIFGNELRSAVVFDFETKNSYTIRIRTTDSGGLYFEKDFTIIVINVNEAPTDINLSNDSIDELKEVGTVIGTFTANDPEGGPFTYQIVGGDTASFTIDGDQLKSAEVFDYNVKPSYSIVVRTTDSTNLSFEKTFTINILQVCTGNKAEFTIEYTGTNPKYSGNKYKFEIWGISSFQGSSVKEWVQHLCSQVTNSIPDYTMSDVSGILNSVRVDWDIGTNNQSRKACFNKALEVCWQVTCVQGTPSGNDFIHGNFLNRKFVGYLLKQCNGAGYNCSGDLGCTQASVSLTTTRELGRRLESDVIPTCQVEPYPPSANPTNPFMVLVENDTEALHMLRFYTTNAIDTDNCQGPYNDWVNQKPCNTGLMHHFLPFAECYPQQNVPVVQDCWTAWDIAQNPNLDTDTEIHTIKLDSEVCESAPTDITLSGNSVAENAVVGTVIGTLSTTDPDAGDTHTYTIVGGDVGSFSIDGNVLKSAEVFDFETKNSYSIRIRTTDAGGLWFEKDFTITVTNENEAPTVLSLDNTVVAENQPVGTVVGSFTTVDPDGGDTHTYALVAGTGDTDNGSFLIEGSQLKTNAVFDYETKSSYTIRVETRDAGGLTTEAQFTITVTNINEAPTVLSLDNTVVAENRPVGTVVGSFTTVDPDGGDTHTYALVAGTGDTDNGSFLIEGSQLKTNAVFDYETKSSYTIRVETRDASDLWFEKTFIITVTNENEAPTDIALSGNSIAENAVVGTVIGTLSTTDPDAGDTHTYTIVGGDVGSFSIDGNVLKSAQVFDFETKNSYSIRIRTTDAGGLWFEKDFTITVTNENEAPTDIALSGNSIAENAVVGTVIGTLSTTDPDAGDTHTYTIVGGDVGSFSIDGNVLKSAQVFDFETKNSYSIRIRTTDASGLWFEKDFTITVTNENEAPTDIALSANTITENAVVGTVIGTLSTTDPDAGDTHTYTIVGGDVGSFSIDGNVLKSAQVFDFETKNSYTIRIRTTDAGGLWFEKDFTITVTNINEAPTVLSLDNTVVAENQPVGTVVGSFTTVDPDGGDTHTYALVAGTGDTDNGSFLIEGSQLKTNAVFDYETKSSYTIRVETRDTSDLWFEKTFIITVTNVNEAPTDITLSANTIAENAVVGTVIGTLSTTDPDAGETHTYSIVGGDVASFSIVGNELQSAQVFDFETKNSYSIRIRTTDASGLWFEKDFTITVTNENEEPTDIALSANTITENAVVGTVIGTLSTTDPDAGDTHTYTIVGGDVGSFSIDGNVLKSAEVFDFETKNSYRIRIRTTDAGGLWFEKDFTITVTNENEAPTVLSLDNTVVAENQPVGTVVGSFATVDPDGGDTHTYALVAGTGDADNGSFLIEGSQLKTNAVFDYETKSSYTIRVETRDAGGLTTEAQFTITVTNINEAPTDITLSGDTIAENATVGTVIGTLSTNDPDVGDTHTYTLVGGDVGSFSIDGNVLKSSEVFDFETKNSYSIRIRTTDAGGLWFEKDFTIIIIDIDECIYVGLNCGEEIYVEKFPYNDPTSSQRIIKLDVNCEVNGLAIDQLGENLYVVEKCGQEGIRKYDPRGTAENNPGIDFYVSGKNEQMKGATYREDVGLIYTTDNKGNKWGVIAIGLDEADPYKGIVFTPEGSQPIVGLTLGHDSQDNLVFYLARGSKATPYIETYSLSGQLIDTFLTTEKLKENGEINCVIGALAFDYRTKVLYVGQNCGEANYVKGYPIDNVDANFVLKKYDVNCKIGGLEICPNLPVT